MPTEIRILIDELSLSGSFDDHPLAKALVESLPIEGDLRTFGDAFYVATEFDHEVGEDTCEEVDVGDIVYWPSALAIQFFFGPTPESSPGSERPVPASEVVKLGRFTVTPGLAAHRDSRRLRFELA